MKQTLVGTKETKISSLARPSLLSSPAGLAILAPVFFLVLLSHRPNVLLHAELWGDDGWTWYPQAYTDGLGSLTIPVGGYLNSFQRLVAIGAQVFPLHTVPTIFATVGLLVQIAPALFLVSDRMAEAWPNGVGRLFFALFSLALPNAFEIHGNLTNSQWHLALLAFLVLVSAPPVGWGGQVFDSLVLLVSGLSGPFCILLLPVALWQVMERRRPVDVWRIGLVGATVLVQIGFLLGHHGQRSLAPLGAGPRTLARIVALQLLIGPELGFRSMESILSSPWWQNNSLPLAITAAGAMISLPVVLHGPRLWQKFALFAALVFTAGLARPQVSATEPQWSLMATPLMGDRYYVFMMLAWVGVLFVLVSKRNWPARILGLALLLLMVVWSIPGDWHGFDMAPTDFVARARVFEAALPGTRMEFPIFPPGVAPMVLVKRLD